MQPNKRYVKKKINREKVEQLEQIIKSELSIREFLEEKGVKLDSYGKGTCPFHADIDPSFFVDEDKEIWH